MFFCLFVFMVKPKIQNMAKKPTELALKICNQVSYSPDEACFFSFKEFVSPLILITQLYFPKITSIN